jgi:hypothetical protein
MSNLEECCKDLSKRVIMETSNEHLKNHRCTVCGRNHYVLDGVAAFNGVFERPKDGK